MYGYGYQYSAIISGGGNPAAAIFGTYKSRVLADGGVVENNACTITFLESIGAGTDIIPSFSFLLDAYSGAAAAYSLRQLNSSYSGDAIRVRRSSDNAELNIGFVANELDTSALTTFASGADAFVTTWYDQSGNANNATQTTAANQPQILISGSLFTQNGKPAIKPVAGLNLAATFTLGSNYSSFQVDTRGSQTINYYIPNRGGSNGNYYWYNVFNAGGTSISSNSGTPSYYVNNNSFTGTTQGQAWTFDTGLQRILSAVNLNLSTWTKYEFQYGIGDNTMVAFQERILYPINQSTNLSGINTNINDYYGIY